jgi:hypothetical protein
LSRLTTGDSTGARQEVVRVGGIDRTGAIAVGTDDAILVAGADGDGDGDVAGGDLVGPLASGTAVIAQAGGGPAAPLAAGCPGTINFDNSAGTSLWGTAANWDLDRLPNATDDVCIGPGSPSSPPERRRGARSSSAPRRRSR